MSFEQGYRQLNPQNLEKPNKKEEKNSDEEGFSRRDFLKWAAEASIGTAFGLGLYKKGAEIGRYFNVRDRGIEETPTAEQQEIFKEDLGSVSAMMDFDKPERIEFDLQKIEKIKEHWKKKYIENPKLADSFKKGFREMGFWKPYLEKIFTQEGLPREYIYLAIPESHWQCGAVSKAQAVGPYQFTEGTGKDYGLRVDGKIDERKDPLKSARSCARFLSDLYKKSGDWGLAFSGYNGGYMNKYLEQNQGKQKSYLSFLKFLEEKSNNLRDTIKKDPGINHKIKEKETLSGIARKFLVDEQTLIKLNHIRHNRIYVGQNLTIPLSGQNRRHIWEMKSRGFVENLNYPAKFNAILELIKEKAIEKQEEPIHFHTKEVRQNVFIDLSYETKKGERVRDIAKNFHVDEKLIRKANPWLKKERRREPHAEQKIKIPHIKKWLTLKNIAPEKFERLKFLNPGIKEDVAIPDGYEIRI